MRTVKVGYIRTSKKDQNPELQRRDLLAAGCEKLFEEQISSRKADRPELRAALEYVREGDALVVWKVPRRGKRTQALTDPGWSAPKVFVSYSWGDDGHRDWVRDFASRLRSDGVDAELDRWRLAPGDQLPEFMERAVRENDFMLIVCTPRYKARADGRVGGVGYEGDIMTAEVLSERRQRKFIPVLRRGDWGKPCLPGCWAN
jgi:hypothetical protein